MKIQSRLIGLFFVSILCVSACKKKDQESGAASLHITGSIQIDPSLFKYAQETDTIFLMVRPAEGGPPLAVEKFMGKNYPYVFELTQKNIMMQQPVEGPLNLTVRVDKDGDPMTKSPGDLIGDYEKNPVSIDAKDVIVTIRERMQ